MTRLYAYVGPPEIARDVAAMPPGKAISSIKDIRAWIAETWQKPGADGRLIATFIVDEMGLLRIADRRSEHVACAGGKAVRSAGEIIFDVSAKEIAIQAVTNQSTGYCPEPESWPAVVTALETTGLDHSDLNGFDPAFAFRRCQSCQTVNIIKDGVFRCSLCGGKLPVLWSFGSNCLSAMPHPRPLRDAAKPLNAAQTCATHSPDAFKAALIARAKAEGFDAAGVTLPEAIGQAGERLGAFLREAMHGDMGWLAAYADRRADPLALWPETRSIVMLGMNYGPESDPLALLAERSRGIVSVYARGRDYHDVIKGKLKLLGGWLHRQTGEAVKVFVDTAPVMEKPLAQQAGVGWQGKHTNLVSREFGSWLFLGAIFTAARLAPDAPERDHCGNCRRCLDVCPTDAFPAPYRLDARRCISYLTIEHKGHIPREFRRPMANRIYGCDDCLAVCPWNKFAQEAHEARFAARPLTDGAPLVDLLGLDDAAFRAAFSGSPVKRSGRDRFIRNVLIAAGNSGDDALLPAVTRHLGDPNPLVRAMAVWAAGELLRGDEPAFAALRARHLPEETDAAVLGEWRDAKASRDSGRPDDLAP